MRSLSLLTFYREYSHFIKALRYYVMTTRSLLLRFFQWKTHATTKKATHIRVYSQSIKKRKGKTFRACNSRCGEIRRYRSEIIYRFISVFFLLSRRLMCARNFFQPLTRSLLSSASRLRRSFTRGRAFQVLQSRQIRVARHTDELYCLLLPSREGECAEYKQKYQFFSNSI